MCGLTVKAWTTRLSPLEAALLWVPSEELEVCLSTGHSHFRLSLTPQVTSLPQEAQPLDSAVGTHLGPLWIPGPPQSRARAGAEASTHGSSAWANPEDPRRPPPLTFPGCGASDPHTVIFRQCLFARRLLWSWDEGA